MKLIVLTNSIENDVNYTVFMLETKRNTYQIAQIKSNKIVIL